mmetsp:Transcript_17078/g.33359  ORF Transcript_17078/g.33359 Transcript_17078/m.33359 type:complete len:406 (-) Transcript_17078:192-1409(-)
MASPPSLSSLCASFRRHIEKEDGAAIIQLLQPSRLPMQELHNASLVQDICTRHGGEVYGEVLSLYLLCMGAKASGTIVRELELACTCLKTWVQRYIEFEGSGLWMTPLMIHLSGMARRAAAQLDQMKKSEANSDAFLKKLVEIHREMFQKLNKEKTKRAGHVWVCCELLRAYFSLDQISQCSFLLNAVCQSLNKDGFNPTNLPKAIAVTFFFYWGKHCVFNHDLREADEKLSWAFNNCPAKSRSNRRMILRYLVPCKLRIGVLPTQELLQQYDLGMFVDIVRAIREGNLKLFIEKMEEQAPDFIKMGTYLPMMKLKFMVLRNLCRGVHREIRRRLDDRTAHKLDLAPFEHIFEWQDGCDADETANLLSTLIYQGAMKGYLSHEHRKLVFAKDTPFPPPSKWRTSS